MPVEVDTCDRSRVAVRSDGGAAAALRPNPWTPRELRAVPQLLLDSISLQPDT